MSAIYLRASLAAAALALLSTADASAQAAATGAFAKVPALPTVCYAGNDPFVARIEAAMNAGQADLDRQKAVNEQIEEQFNNIDPMEMATRMQQWMMSNPQEAMRYAQMTQAVGQETQEDLGGLLAEEQAFGEEKTDLPKRYQSALEQGHAPSDARRAALFKKIEAAGQCEGMHEGCRMTDADWAEHDAIQKQRDAEYQATCAQYFGATGQVPAYLKRYREWLVAKRIPFGESGDGARLTQYAIMNTPAASWKSTEAGEQVLKYMGAVESLYRLRDSEPNCTAAGCKR